KPMAPAQSRPSRRTVIRCAAFAAGTLVLPIAQLRGADERAFNFALVSETHLGKDKSPQPAANLGQVVEEINASDAEFTIFCGDLVHAGQEKANQTHYPEFKRLADGLKRPWFAVPGN